MDLNDLMTILQGLSESDYWDHSEGTHEFVLDNGIGLRIKDLGISSFMDIVGSSGYLSCDEYGLNLRYGIPINRINKVNTIDLGDSKILRIEYDICDGHSRSIAKICIRIYPDTRDVETIVKREWEIGEYR